MIKKTTSESKKERRKQKTRRNEREHQNSDDFKLYACLKKIIQQTRDYLNYIYSKNKIINKKIQLYFTIYD